MPTYSFRLPSGKVIERFFYMADMPQHIEVGGEIAKRDMTCDPVGVMGTSRTHSRPNSHLGVHPSQVGEVNALYERRGCRPAVHDSFGDPIPEDRAHENSMIKARGMYHQHAGYGDVTPGLANVVKDNV